MALMNSPFPRPYGTYVRCISVEFWFENGLYNIYDPSTARIFIFLAIFEVNLLGKNLQNLIHTSMLVTVTLGLRPGLGFGPVTL